MANQEVQMADAEVQRSYIIYTRSRNAIDFMEKSCLLPITDEGQTKVALLSVSRVD